MTGDHAWQKVTAPRTMGIVPGFVLMGLRMAAGAVFVVFGAGKFVTFSSEVDHFEAFGLPWPTAAVVLAGLVEIVGGLMLLLGLLVRPAAVILAIDMALAIATAGRVEGGLLHLGLAPALLLLMLAIAWSGGTGWSLDARSGGRTGT